MEKKVKIGIILIIASGFLIYGAATGSLMSYAFDQINYNYTGFASIPNNTVNGGSLGGPYNINGKGQKFKFTVALKGAENFEDPLCYTKDGLTADGKLDTINVNSNTIMALMNKDFKKAMFVTPLTGHFNMSCAAWTGYGNFTNNGTDFPGNFKIDGAVTDWEGTFKFIPDGNKIAIITSYIWYPHGQKATGPIHNVNKTYYM
ncbi:hypothetical protein [Methanobacterium sp. SMA-27]|uniref:hypothetical protein n=1 Tax=Methanobacterium sp. SMA-27 TaxID=1495336 RepID=UPI000693893D|nr:hypothetical protein [Methanobacterium sp. SMA-27]